jgi:GT2 family glycosyltransferase
MHNYLLLTKEIYECKGVKMKPKVSIIILTYNSKSTLGRILDEAIMSALSQDYPNVEVIIADNGSQDDTYEYIKSKYGAHVKVIRFDKNYGFCLGNNLASKFVDPEAKYILFQNPDAILSQNYIKVLVEVMEQNPTVGAIQGLEVKSSGEKLIGFFMNSAGYYHEVLLEKDLKLRQCIEVLHASGAALLVRRRLFEAVGGFSPDYFLYFDEADLAFRFHALGFKILGCKNTNFVHMVGGTVTKLTGFRPIIYYFHTRNRIYTIIKYFYGKFLLSALLMNAIILLKHLLFGYAMRRRLVIRVLLNIKKLGDNIRIRKNYIKALKERKVLERFI